MSVISHAIDYGQRGWQVVPLFGKDPSSNGTGWQNLRINTEPDIRKRFKATNNVGVLLGEPSRWLVDIDLDHELAVKLAPDYLPPTQAIFGRPGKPRSHCLYHAIGAETHQRRADELGMIVELRSTGAQTMFPGSVHPAGEPVRWDSAGAPPKVDSMELRCAVDELADQVMRKLGVGLSEHGLAYAECSQVVATPVPKPTAVISSTIRRARAYVASMPPAVSGSGGHKQTFLVACKLVRGFCLNDEVAWRLLCQYNARCEPPWNERELKHKLDEARDKSKFPSGFLIGEAP